MPVGAKNTIIQGCGTHHIALQTRDLADSLKLYQDVLGMKIVSEFGTPERKIILLDIGDGSHMELFQPQTDTPAPDSPPTNDTVIHFAFNTTDVYAAVEIVRQAGYTITTEPKDVVLPHAPVTIAFFRGPSGELIELFQENK